MRILPALHRVTLGFGLALAAQTVAAGAQNRFDHPIRDGLPVDHCESLGSNCGSGGATLFCREQGFSRATAWNTYNAGRSITLGSGQICDSGYCTAFRDVTCVNDAAYAPDPSPRRGGDSQAYAYPSVSGLYIDHCESAGSNCGRGGADIFCRSQGFGGAESWQTFNAGRTVILGSRQECTSGYCTGFSEVICGNGRVAGDDRRRGRDRDGYGGDRRGRDGRGRDGRGGDQLFARPNVQGYAIDHCETYGSNCGKGGADAFCRSQGFDGASAWETYAPGATYVPGSRRHCNGPECRALRDVRCSSHADPYRPYDGGGYGGGPALQKRFEYPQLAGAPVDHCAEFGQFCGQGGADLFCREQGFDDATAWTTFEARRTYVIGSRQHCTSGYCTGLSSVTCIGGGAVRPGDYGRNRGERRDRGEPRRYRLRIQ